MASVAIDHKKEVYICIDVICGHHVYTCEVTGGKKRGNEMEVTCVYCFVEKRHWLINKLEVLLQPCAVHESSPLIFTGFAKSLNLYVSFCDIYLSNEIKVTLE